VPVRGSRPLLRVQVVRLPGETDTWLAHSPVLPTKWLQLKKEFICTVTVWRLVIQNVSGALRKTKTKS
jgi:hypothetical protein